MTSPKLDPSRPRVRLTDAQIADALRQANGLISVASRMLGITRPTIYRRAAKSQQIKQAIADARAEVVDLAESALRKAVERGESWAVVFALKTLGRKRGYGDVVRTELTGADGAPIRIQAVDYYSAIADIAPADAAPRPSGDSASPPEDYSSLRWSEVGEDDHGG